MQEENTNYTPPVYPTENPRVDKPKKAIPTFLGIAIIVVAVVLFGGVFAWQYFLMSQKQPLVQNEYKNQHFISSAPSLSGTIGTEFELKGYNLLDNRGDQNLIIENSNNETASLGSGDPEHLNLSENYAKMKFTLSEKVCKNLATDAGLPCTSWMTIVPGEYSIYVIGLNPAFTSNKIKLTVLPDTAGWKTYTNTQYGFEFKYPTGWSVGISAIYPNVVMLCPKELASDDPDIICKPTNNAPHMPAFESVIIYNLLAGKFNLIDQNYKNIFDQISSTFKFANSTTQLVTIASPNGGEVWKIGETHRIKWDIINAPRGSTTIIELFTRDVNIDTYIKKLFEGGTYELDPNPINGKDWVIGADIVPGNNYFIKIYIRDSGGKSAAYDISDNYFTITK